LNNLLEGLQILDGYYSETEVLVEDSCIIITVPSPPSSDDMSTTDKARLVELGWERSFSYWELYIEQPYASRWSQTNKT